MSQLSLAKAIAIAQDPFPTNTDELALYAFVYTASAHTALTLYTNSSNARIRGELIAHSPFYDPTHELSHVLLVDLRNWPYGLRSTRRSEAFNTSWLYSALRYATKSISPSEALVTARRLLQDLPPSTRHGMLFDCIRMHTLAPTVLDLIKEDPSLLNRSTLAKILTMVDRPTRVALVALLNQFA